MKRILGIIFTIIGSLILLLAVRYVFDGMAGGAGFLYALVLIPPGVLFTWVGAHLLAQPNRRKVFGTILTLCGVYFYFLAFMSINMPMGGMYLREFRLGLILGTILILTGLYLASKRKRNVKKVS